MTLRRHARGQSSVEQALLLVVAVAALVAMFSYIRSSLSHRFKVGADGMGHGLLYPQGSEVITPTPSSTEPVLSGSTTPATPEPGGQETLTLASTLETWEPFIGADGTLVIGTSADGTSASGTSADGTSAETTPAETTPAETTPAETTPAETTPSAWTSADGTSAGWTPVSWTPPADAGGLVFPLAGDVPVLEASGYHQDFSKVIGYNPDFGIEHSKHSGQKHGGVDVFGPDGTPILTSEGGTVIRTYRDPSLINSTLGHVTVLSDDGSHVMVYRHLSEIYVSEGQSVDQGIQLGKIGGRPQGTWPHLHFEVYVRDGVPPPGTFVGNPIFNYDGMTFGLTNPYPFLTGSNVYATLPTVYTLPPGEEDFL